MLATSLRRHSPPIDMARHRTLRRVVALASAKMPRRWCGAFLIMLLSCTLSLTLRKPGTSLNYGCRYTSTVLDSTILQCLPVQVPILDLPSFLFILAVFFFSWNTTQPSCCDPPQHSWTHLARTTSSFFLCIVLPRGLCFQLERARLKVCLHPLVPYVTTA